MIKLVVKNSEENKIFRKICNKCGITLEFEKNDAQVGELGCYYVVCPNCYTDVYVDEIEPIELDEHNIQFPTHFYKFGKEDGAINIEDKEIQQWVRTCLNKIKENDNDFWIAGSGNTKVIVLNYADEYEVIVAKNYYDCSIFKD